MDSEHAVPRQVCQAKLFYDLEKPELTLLHANTRTALIQSCVSIAYDAGVISCA